MIDSKINFKSNQTDSKNINNQTAKILGQRFLKYLLLATISLNASFSLATTHKEEIVGFFVKGRKGKICFEGIDAKTRRYYASFPMLMLTKNQVKIMSACHKDKVAQNAYISIERVYKERDLSDLEYAYFIVKCYGYDDREPFLELLEDWRREYKKSSLKQCL